MQSHVIEVSHRPTAALILEIRVTCDSCKLLTSLPLCVSEGRGQLEEREGGGLP